MKLIAFCMEKIALDTDVMMAMNELLHQQQVSHVTASELLVLKSYDIVLLVDDSGSMKKKDKGCSGTRWEELQDTLNLVISTVGCFKTSGIDVYFLNREKIPNVVMPEDERLKNSMLRLPRGSTPLTRSLQNIILDRETAARTDRSLLDKPVLLMIFTDGEPDEGPSEFGDALLCTLKQKSTQLKFHCQIMACTGCDDEIGWLKVLDNFLEELDVTDDFLTEKSQVQLKSSVDFTRGDWLMKAMLGAIHSKHDCMNESRKRPNDMAEHLGSKRHKKQKTSSADALVDEPVKGISFCLKWFLVMAVLLGMCYIFYALHTLKGIGDEFAEESDQPGTVVDTWTPAEPM